MRKRRSSDDDVTSARSKIPDVRDGLTRAERIVLWQISLLQQERGGRDVPTAMLYGRVVEHLDLTVPQLQEILQRLIGKQTPKR